MGTEYRFHAPSATFADADLNLICEAPTFWKRDEKYGSYFLGKIEGSDWPVAMAWIKQGDIGITLNGSATSDAWRDIQSFVLSLERKYPDLQITGWDDEEDLRSSFYE
jgi:hypothetical protein